MRTAWLAVVSAAFWGWLIWSQESLPEPHPVTLPRGLAPVPTLPARAGYDTPEDCGACHEKAYRAWSGSRHAHASTGDLFRIGFQVEPSKWCVGCHAPGETDPVRMLERGRGVTCRDCHARADGIATVRDPARMAAPHPLVRDPGLAVQTCERCHESDIPLAPERLNQDTMDEWRTAGGERTGTCIGCHAGAPGDPGDRGHALAASRNSAFLARGVPVSARWLPRRDQFELVIGPVVSGHRVPTGDPFRELVLEWDSFEAGGRVDRRRSTRLGRKEFTEGFSIERVSHPGFTGPEESSDNRLRHGETRTLVVDVSPDATRVEVRASLALIARKLWSDHLDPKVHKETPFAKVTLTR